MSDLHITAAMPEGARHAMLDRVRTPIAAAAEPAGKATVSMPCLTNRFWCHAI
jgi:hypothetical protein